MSDAAKSPEARPSCPRQATRAAGAGQAADAGQAGLRPSGAKTRRSSCRRFLHLVRLSAWATFTAAMAGMTLGTLRFLFPNVLSEPPSKVKVGFPDTLRGRQGRRTLQGPEHLGRAATTARSTP